MTKKHDRLIAQLSDENESIRAAAAEALCQLGEEARFAAIRLVDACDDGCESVREWAAAALEGLGPPEATEVEALLAIASTRGEDAAFWAITLLGRFGAQCDSTVIESLTHIAQNHSCEVVRRRADWALGKIS